jgi:hypothetical protein
MEVARQAATGDLIPLDKATVLIKQQHEITTGTHDSRQ